MPEHYVPGYSANAIDFMTRRTADTHAAFLKPYLHSGMEVLDCGCGPGSITVGIAAIVAPGTVTAIDQAASQVALAQSNAARLAITNINFVQANLYSLPFADRQFDAVFAHAVLEHVLTPVRALQELWRVLKPGGLIGVRSPDWSGFLIAPATPGLDAALTAYQQLHQQNGGNPYIGRELRALLRQAGFTAIKASGTYECYEPVSLIAEYLAQQLDAETALPSHLGKTLRDWSQHPDALFAQSWCEAIAWKDSPPA